MKASIYCKKISLPIRFRKSLLEISLANRFKYLLRGQLFSFSVSPFYQKISLLEMSLAYRFKILYRGQLFNFCLPFTSKFHSKRCSLLLAMCIHALKKFGKRGSTQIPGNAPFMVRRPIFSDYHSINWEGDTILLAPQRCSKRTSVWTQADIRQWMHIYANG